MMSSSEPTPGPSPAVRADILYLAQRHINDTGLWPPLKWIAEKVNKSVTTVSVVISPARYNGQLNLEPLDEGRPTDRERQILDIISTSIAEKGFPPSMREVSGELEVSTQTAWADSRKMQKKGLINRNPGSHRALWVTDKGKRYITEGEQKDGK